MYVKEPGFYKDANGNDVVNIFPTNKFLVANYNTIIGNWPTKFGKAIDANVVSLILTINPVSFEGKRGMGSKEGASIEAIANMTIYPSCTGKQ